MQLTKISPSDPKLTQRPLLLHCCCGPCASACVERLLAENIRPILFFSNSNLDSQDEFDLRLENLQKVAQHFQLSEVLVDEYTPEDWLKHISQCDNFQDCPERGLRCQYCFQWQLTRTAIMAQKLNADFTTSLTVSPHKNSDLIFNLGNAIAPNAFKPYNFKKQNGFLRSIQLSKELSLYRQNYCGCIFSKN